MTKRQKMIESIKEGNAIYLYPPEGGFKVFTLDNIDELPSEAALAIGNTEDEAVALEGIEAQLASLEAAKKQLLASKKDTKKEVTEEKVEEVKTTEKTK